MASIRQRGSSYQITVSKGYDSKGKKLLAQKTVKRPEELTDKQWEKELDRLSHEFENTVQLGTSINSSITLSGFVERWMEEYATKQLQPKTISSYEIELTTKILPALGHLRLDKIQPVQLLSFYNNLLEDGVRVDGKSGPYSNRTIKYQHQILSSILQTAVYWQVIQTNPCERVKPPRRDTLIQKVKHFDENQSVIFLEGIKKEELKYQVCANIALYGGLRKGEVLGLTWNDINLDEGTININKVNQYLKETGTFTKKTKNPSSVREISIPGNVVALLRKYKLWQNKQIIATGDLWQQEWKLNKTVLTQWDGTPMGYSTPYQWITIYIKGHNKKIMEDLTIPDNEKCKYLLPKIPFHGLRHTSATLLITEKMDIKTVSARLGHAQTSTTLNTYSHNLKSSDQKAAATLENLLDKNRNIPELKQV